MSSPTAQALASRFKITSMLGKLLLTFVASSGFAAAVGEASCDMPSAEDSATYVVRYGDLDGDALMDLFIAPARDAAMQEFILRQSASKRFELLKSATAVRSAAAHKWPIAQAGVLRDDLNFDGQPDLMIEGIEAVAPGAADVIVYTTGGARRTAEKAVSLDRRFFETWGKVTEILRHGREPVLKFYSASCVEPSAPANLTLGDVTYDWLHNTYPNAWYRDAYIEQFGEIRFRNEIVEEEGTDLACFPRGLAAPAEVQMLIRSWGDYLGLGGADCVRCGHWAVEQLRRDPKVRLLVPPAASKTGVEESAFYVTGLLIANDPLVGVIDDILVPVTAILGGWVEAVKVIHPADREEAAAPGCGGLSPVSLSSVAGVYAHPIVHPSSQTVSAIAARAMLSEHGIDVLDAVNRVLISSLHERSHRAGRMHSRQFEDQVLDRLRLALARNREQRRALSDAQAIREELRQLARELSDGRAFGDSLRASGAMMQ